MINKIVIKGAKEHNLKNGSVEIAKENFSVSTVMSGTGKSSPDMATLYAEDQV